MRGNMVRCPATKQFLGVTLQCTREWDTHHTGHAYRVHETELPPLPGHRAVVTRTIHPGRNPVSTVQLQLALGSEPPEGWAPQA